MADVKHLNTIYSTLGQYKSLYCVYEHWIISPHGPMPVYVGMCMLRNIWEFPDARRNTSWNEVITPKLEFQTRIVFTSESKAICERHHSTLVMQHDTYCNKHGMQMGNIRSIIVCNETNAVYESAKACAEAEGISQTSLSFHLNGRPNWPKIKGKTYRRGLKPSE